MADPQYIVDQIRAFVAGTDQTLSPELRDLAENYAALCNGTNARLRRCVDFLRRGLRAEAIHLAEEHPLLLELVASLDLDEAPEWESLCATYDLARPPPLLIEAAQEINEAYALSQPLDALLDRHRRLALERAPLASRISVMHLLAKADPASTFWIDDLRTFETVRIKQLKAEALNAIKAKDRSTLARLKSETGREGWLIDAAADLTTLIQRSEVGFAQEEAVRKMRVILPDLELALDAREGAAVAGFATEIRRLMRDAHVAAPPDIAAPLDHAERMIASDKSQRDRQAQFTAACATLSAAIDQDAPAADLERLKADALQFGAKLPEGVEGQMTVSLRRQADRRRKASRTRNAVLAVVAVILLTSGGLIARIISRRQQGDAAYHHLAGLVDQSNFDAADAELKKISVDTPYATERPDIQQLASRIAHGRKDVIEHQKNYTTALVAAQTSFAEAQNSSLKGAAVWKPVDARIVTLSAVAETDFEKAEAEKLRTALEERRKDAGRAESERRSQALASLTMRAKSVEASAPGEQDRNENLSLTIKEASDLSNEAATAGDEGTRAGAEALITHLNTVVDQSARRKIERQELAAVVDAARDPARLAQAMKEFSERCSSSEHAARFRASRTRARAWESVEEASRLLSSWSGKLQPDAGELADRLKSVAAYRRQFASSPFTSAFADYGNYLSAGQVSTAPDGPWRDDFRSILALPLLKDLQSLKTNEGKRYYLAADTKLSKDSIGTTVRYIVSSDLNSPKRVTLRPDQFSGDLAPSPQVALTATAGRMIDSIGANWDTFAFDLMVHVVESKEVDPILRAILLDRALKFGGRCAWGGEDVLRATAEDIAKLNGDSVAWMNPDDKDVAAKRQMAAQLLDAKLPELKTGRGAVIDRRNRLFNRLKFQIAGRGVLLLDEGHWTLATAGKLVDGQKAYIVTADRLQLVAECRDGRFVVDPNAVSTSLDGEMVFVASPDHHVP